MGRTWAAEPSALFVGSLHNRYVTHPLHDTYGLEFDTCKPADMAARLDSGKFSVVIVDTLHAEQLAALDAFLARGGAVIACAPRSYPDQKAWAATAEWLAKLGARTRWEMLQDTDKANVVSDVMGCQLSASTDISPAFKTGGGAVLTLLARSTTGWEPPMSWDIGADWQVIVRGAPSMVTKIDKRNDPALVPWIPSGTVTAPVLAAWREVGKGRLAVLPFRYYWIFSPPPNCPTSEAMLSAGAGGRSSNWLEEIAHMIRQLGQPAVAAGLAGATTPDALLNPPPRTWEKAGPIEWLKEPAPFEPQLQTKGLIGARTALSGGTGTVADYVREAKAAGLQYIVFLEDSLHMDQAAWDQLMAQCKAASDDTFVAVPGLTYEDAQGNHHYAFSDKVAFPKPAMLLEDGRLATIQPMRSRAFFDYDNELLGQQAIRGFWNHAANELPIVDYKLYNSFPVKSFLDGKPIDDNLQDFLYLQGIGGCQAVLALELMTSPGQVAERARNGWLAIANRPATTLRDQWFRGAFSFSGSGSQYITNGPRILVWEAPNRLTDARGEWWRPDLWEWRIRLRVASDAGLKRVTVLDGNRQLLRHWMPVGEKEFQHEWVLSNAQQLAPTLIVEDVNGRQAISMSFYSRNLIKEEFFCSDRCNFLGNSRLRARDDTQHWTQVGFQNNMGITPSKGRLSLGETPAVFLTPNSPTLPIDGKPAGFPTVSLGFGPQIPGELPNLFAYPQTYLVGPDIGIGQADWKLAYDPAEVDAKQTRLGHEYVQPQVGWGNAWGSWYRLVPTAKAEGLVRIYAPNWVPGEFRIGGFLADLTLKAPVTIDPKIGGIPVMHPSMGGWLLRRDGQPVDLAGVTEIPFTPGTYAILQHAGGAAVVAPYSGDLTLKRTGKDSFQLLAAAGKSSLPAGARLDYAIVFAGAPGTTTVDELDDFARQFGIATPGQVAWHPLIRLGKQVDNRMVWRLDGQGVGVAATIPKTPLRSLLLTAVQGLHDNWSTVYLNRAQAWPNHRGVAIRDGVAWAEVDVAGGDQDLFIGHPVVADTPDVTIQAAWERPGSWFVEAHNPTGSPLHVHLTTPPQWPLFKLDKTVDLPPGTSQVWHVATER